jgi:hypothetical protein
MRVRIENDSKRPLRVRYDDLALVAADGTRYNALPPFQIEGGVYERVYPVAPGFHHDRFYIAPHHSRHFPSFGPPYGPFDHDPFVYGHYFRYWDRVELPTARMLELAIPEGVVEPGGMLEGFVYFEPIDPSENDAVLRFDLVDARAGAQFAEARIPFEVAGGWSVDRGHDLDGNALPRRRDP